MFDRSKSKIGCSSSITKRLTRSSLFDVRKNDVWVCSISNLVNLVKALLCSMFDRLKPRIGCSSSITNRWTHSCSFNVWKMMFKSDPCSIKWCSTHHYKYLTLSNQIPQFRRLSNLRLICFWLKKEWKNPPFQFFHFTMLLIFLHCFLLAENIKSWQ